MRTLWGCGTLVLLFVLAGLGLTLTVMFTKPKPADFGVQTFDHAFDLSRESEGFDLPPDSAGQKPIKVIVECSMASIQLLPGEELGKIKVDGDFDQANYQLTTDVKELEDYVEYRVRFKNTRPFVSMLFSGSIDEQRNRITVHLPRDLHLGLEMCSKMGEAEVDLTGIPVEYAELSQSMGAMRLVALKPNPISMKHLNVSLSAGEMKVEDLQNYRFSDLTFDGSMGEVRFSSTGDLIESAKANLDMSMGEMRVYVPPNARLNTDISVSAGNYEGPRGSSSSEEGDKAPVFEIKGDISMGELVVGQKTHRKSIDDLLMTTILSEGIDAAIDEYRRLKNEQAGAYDFRERVLNRLGYRLLRRNMNQEAIGVFKLNIEVYPEYANGYDSLGEAYMNADQLDLAVENYEKSLELDPANENAAKMLARLSE